MEEELVDDIISMFDNFDCDDGYTEKQSQLLELINEYKKNLITRFDNLPEIEKEIMSKLKTHEKYIYNVETPLNFKVETPSCSEPFIFTFEEDDIDYYRIYSARIIDESHLLIFKRTVRGIDEIGLEKLVNIDEKNIWGIFEDLEREYDPERFENFWKWKNKGSWQYG